MGSQKKRVNGEGLSSDRGGGLTRKKGKGPVTGEKVLERGKKEKRGSECREKIEKNKRKGAQMGVSAAG